jgi:L-threonylcarbamoyladenylate synthase
LALLLRPENSGNIEFAVELLESGKPVALPTETVYGLAASLFDPQAIAKVFQIKNRPYFDPLIVHVLEAENVREIVNQISPLQESLMKKFWPGPLTLLFEKNSLVPDLATAGGPWVAIRSPRHPLFRKILSKISRPFLVAPSANRFTSVSPTSAEDVLRELGAHGLEAVVDGGRCELGLESTVVKVESSKSTAQLTILRPGAVSAEDILEALPAGTSVSINAGGSGVSTISPGTHSLHYSPGLPIRFFKSVDELRSALPTLAISDCALLEVLRGQCQSLGSLPWARRMELGSTKMEAAQNIFAALRTLGSSGVRMVITVAVDDSGLGLALNDRLRRAAGEG